MRKPALLLFLWRMRLRRMCSDGSLARGAVLAGMVMLLCFPGVAYGSDDTSSTAALLDFLLKVVLIIVSVLVPLWLRSWLEPKIGKERAALLCRLAGLGVNYAEEAARKHLKETGQSLTGNEKLERASHLAMTLAERSGLTNYSDVELRKLVEAALDLRRQATVEEPRAVAGQVPPPT